MNTSTTYFAHLVSNAQEQRDLITIEKDTIKAIATENKVTIRAFAIQLDLVNALIKRMNNQLVNGKTQEINSSMFTDLRTLISVNFLHTIEKLLKEKFDLSNVAVMLGQTDHKHDDFMQVYAITKVINLLQCIAQKNRRGMNAYTLAILVNLMKHGSISKKEAEQAVCLDLHRASNRSKLIGQREIINVYNSASSTASTQISSSRMTLKALNICHINKNSVNDEMSFNSDGQYLQNVLDILQMNENTDEELERVSAEIEREQDKKAKKVA